MSEVKRPRWPDCLGDTEEAIVATLISAGVKGVRGCPRSCVVAASYKHFCPNGWSGLRARYTPDAKSVALTFNDAQIMDPEATHGTALASFMAHFDKGLYPQLELSKKPVKVKTL